MGQNEKNTVEFLQVEVTRLQEELQELRKRYQEETYELQGHRSVLSTVLGCGVLDTDEIVKMEENFPGVTEDAMELTKELGSDINFGVFVYALKNRAIDDVSDDIADDQTDVLRDIIIDDNYSAWGGVVSYGTPTFVLSADAQEAFAVYVQSGDEEDRETFLEMAAMEAKETM